MVIDELLKYREDLSNDSKDENGFITSQLLLEQVLPSMLESKLIDSDDYEECFHSIDKSSATIDGHTVNESQERLQLFVLDKKTTDTDRSREDLLISQKQLYEKPFRAVSRFVRSAINGDMDAKLQDSSTVKLLVNHLNSPDGLEQIDVIEIFFITITATVSFRGNEPAVRSMHFDDETIPVKWTQNGAENKKEILILKKVIDLNLLYNVQMSMGNGEPLEVRFDKIVGTGIDAIKAASEEYFESYLCVLPANILVELYKRYSSRLLEKNVRSFLQFRGVNAGIKKTIKDEPEKFIAYNNGLTITATNAKISFKKGKLQIQSLTDFQIVNGGQTTATIYFSKKEGLNVSKVRVMAKINVAKNNDAKGLDQLISNISRYSNAQSRVSNVDLNSRNPELIKLKKLSLSITTPTGKKWFFERAKGEYQTQIRLAGRKKKQIKIEYPVARRFSKELLAKYYSAWGDEPYKVKKGGEKIFRHFIEELIKGSDNKPIEINREFYENTVAKIILFRSMEKIYGQGKNAMGQLRSAVIPYSLSILFRYSDYSKNAVFNMERIWKSEGIDDDLRVFLHSLMLLVNKLIKKYSMSDDFGEYSKKQQLWDDISTSKEVIKFMKSADSVKILKKYCK
jgi:hypothetical protein